MSQAVLDVSPPSNVYSANEHQLIEPALVNGLQILKRASIALKEAQSFEEVRHVRDKADAVRVYAKNANAGLELQNNAAELKLRAERRAGKLLRSMPLRGGDRRSKKAGSRITLAQLNITQNQSTRWQKLATVPEEAFFKAIAAAHQNQIELTTTALLRMANASVRKPGDKATSDNIAHRSSKEIIEELLSHWGQFEEILAPLSKEGNQAILESADVSHLQALIRKTTVLLTGLQSRSCRGSKQ